MPDLKSSIARRIDAASSVAVWTPSDFVDLASRAAIDKTLQRMVKAGELRRIDRGLYDKPKTNPSDQPPYDSGFPWGQSMLSPDVLSAEETCLPREHPFCGGLPISETSRIEGKIRRGKC